MFAPPDFEESKSSSAEAILFLSDTGINVMVDAVYEDLVEDLCCNWGKSEEINHDSFLALRGLLFWE